MACVFTPIASSRMTEEQMIELIDSVLRNPSTRLDVERRIAELYALEAADSPPSRAAPESR